MVYASNFFRYLFVNSNSPATSVLLTLEKSLMVHKITAIFSILILKSENLLWKTDLTTWKCLINNLWSDLLDLRKTNPNLCQISVTCLYDDLHLARFLECSFLVIIFWIHILGFDGFMT